MVLDKLKYIRQGHDSLCFSNRVIDDTKSRGTQRRSDRLMNFKCLDNKMDQLRFEMERSSVGTFGIKCTQVTSLVQSDKIDSLTPNEVELLYRAKCKDMHYTFENVQPQFQKFIIQTGISCINRKLDLVDMNLGLTFAKQMVKLSQNWHENQLSHISCLNFSKNLLKDDGVIELSNLIHLMPALSKIDLSSNSLTPRGLRPFSLALSGNQHVSFINLSTL